MTTNSQGEVFRFALDVQRFKALGITDPKSRAAHDAYDHHEFSSAERLFFKLCTLVPLNKTSKVNRTSRDLVRPCSGTFRLGCCPAGTQPARGILELLLPTGHKPSWQPDSPNDRKPNGRH